MSQSLSLVLLPKVVTAFVTVCQFLEVGGSVNFELLSCLTLNVEQKAFSSIPRAGGAGRLNPWKVENREGSVHDKRRVQKGESKPPRKVTRGRETVCPA